MKELRRSSLAILRKSVLTYRKAELAFFCSNWLFFHEYHVHRTAWKGGASLYPFYHFHQLQKHLGISQVVAVESTPLRIAGSRTQTGNLWFPSGSR